MIQDIRFIHMVDITKHEVLLHRGINDMSVLDDCRLLSQTFNFQMFTFE